MTQLTVVAADLAAVALLAFGVYFPRHHRRDLLTAYVGVNLGVVAVSLVLGSATVGLGLGLGLFGVLSIIRLRSDEIAQHEIAYYFAALALGLVAGITGSVDALSVGLMALIVAGLYAVDHPRLFRRHRVQTIRLDHAQPDPEALHEQLARLVGGRVLHITVKSVDFANDTTLVEVRYVAGHASARSASPSPLQRVAS